MHSSPLTTKPPRRSHGLRNASTSGASKTAVSLSYDSEYSADTQIWRLRDGSPMTDEFFPVNYADHPFAAYCAAAFEELSCSMQQSLPPRIPGWSAVGVDETLAAVYGVLPAGTTDAPMDLI